MSEIVLRSITMAAILQRVGLLRRGPVEAILWWGLCIRGHGDHSVAERYGWGYLRKQNTRKLNVDEENRTLSSEGQARVVMSLCGGPLSLTCTPRPCDVWRTLGWQVARCCSTLSACLGTQKRPAVDKERRQKPLAIVAESSIAVLSELVARVSLNPRVCSENGVANLKSPPADLHLVRRSIQILVITALDLSSSHPTHSCARIFLVHSEICTTAADIQATLDTVCRFRVIQLCDSLLGRADQGSVWIKSKVRHARNDYRDPPL